jgi:hypothetical protein
MKLSKCTIAVQTFFCNNRLLLLLPALVRVRNSAFAAGLHLQIQLNLAETTAGQKIVAVKN